MPTESVDASPPPVAAVGAADVEAAIAVIVRAFATDPMARWCYPDPAQYLRFFPGVVRAFGRGAFAGGTADEQLLVAWHGADRLVRLGAPDVGHRDAVVDRDERFAVGVVRGHDAPHGSSGRRAAP